MPDKETWSIYKVKVLKGGGKCLVFSFYVLQCMRFLGQRRNRDWHAFVT